MAVNTQDNIVGSINNMVVTNYTAAEVMSSDKTQAQLQVKVDESIDKGLITNTYDFNHVQIGVSPRSHS